MDGIGFAPAELRRRFARFSSAATGAVPQRGDHNLNPDMPPPVIWREAAVLVPLVKRADGLTVIFTRRTEHLSAHAGQISFPGGRLEPDDLDAEAAALRETEEEIGLSRHHVEVIGRLDPYLTRTGFRVEPVVGLVVPPFALSPDPNEVAEIFEVPLSVILDPALPRTEGFQVPGSVRQFYVFPYLHYIIWGATAGMLVNLRDVLS
ncbi:MAG: CoA pyrophosphatase [Rhodospirillaceae bacterium]